MSKQNSKVSMSLFLPCALLLSGIANAAPAHHKDHGHQAKHQDQTQLQQPTVTPTSNAFALNSSHFGWSGPVSFGITRDNLYKYGGNIQYNQMLWDGAAASVIGEYASDAYRLNGTIGFNVLTKGLLKLTAERLSQILPFNFDSGSVDHRMGQNAFGARYQHVLDNNFIRNINLGGYYSHTPNDLLGSTRRIAGGTSRGLDLGTDVTVTSSTLLNGNVYYDDVTYDTVYSGTKYDSKGIGGSFGITQLLNDCLKFNVDTSVRKIYNTFSAGIHWLPPVLPELGLEVSVLGEKVIGHNNSPQENKYGLQFNFSPGKIGKYVPQYDATTQDLISWVSKPAVYMERVLAVADQVSDDSQPSQSGINLRYNSKSLLDNEVIALPAGSPGSYNIITASGVNWQSGYSWRISNVGNLVANLITPTVTVDNNGKATINIAVAPEAMPDNNCHFTIQLLNSQDAIIASRSIPVNIAVNANNNEIPAIASNQVFTFVSNATIPEPGAIIVAYGQNYSSSGPTDDWKLASGSTMPDGLSLSSGGYITGTPTKAGEYTVNVTAKGLVLRLSYSSYSGGILEKDNWVLRHNVVAGTIKINVVADTSTFAAPIIDKNQVIFFNTSGGWRHGELVAHGGTGSYIWAVASGLSLPSGITLQANYGTLVSSSDLAVGTYRVKVVATDRITNKVSAPEEIVIVVQDAKVKLSQNNAHIQMQQGKNNYTDNDMTKLFIRSNPTSTYTWQTYDRSGVSVDLGTTVTPRFPPGISMSPTGMLTGTPTGNDGGFYSVFLVATDTATGWSSPPVGVTFSVFYVK